ncbi:MAG: hypothetical protein A3F72_04245 [Bacteroidetes bacterium RIFCSPLOWO2_12_FULL_35_15]|nr:MAG: hypothetical protein A3F72_04245 [Bacteroidetes bacterium RIFCSPLOWO2_12_FULL_35_15]
MGWFAKKWEFETESDVEHFEKDELEEKKQKLLEVEKRVNELQLHKESIEKRERKFFISARTVVGALLLGFMYILN